MAAASRCDPRRLAGVVRRQGQGRRGRARLEFRSIGGTLAYASARIGLRGCDLDEARGGSDSRANRSDQLREQGARIPPGLSLRHAPELGSESPLLGR